jgi:hypothetical protein
MQIQPTQLKALYAMLPQVGVDTKVRSARLAYVNGFRLAWGLAPITSFNDMTAEEAAKFQRAVHAQTNKERQQ